MLYDNPLLVQLKEKLHAQIPRAEGIVKGTEKKFGFLESDTHKIYFIPPLQMKKVMHGDRIIAIIHSDSKGEHKSAEPESLVEPFLTRFVGRIQKKNGQLLIHPDHPLLKNFIVCRPQRGLEHNFQTGDWAVARMCSHPLQNKKNQGFFAELIEFITTNRDNFAPWWIALSRYNLERQAPELELNYDQLLNENLQREDLTYLDFITIDNSDTEDIDDALHITETPEDNLLLNIAIADPTAYIPEGSKLDQLASKRAFTNYLPGLNIPMLPCELSNNICSILPNKRRPVLVCRVTVLKDGSLADDIYFFVAWIKSKAKLIYNNVSDWLENIGNWKPESQAIGKQIRLLYKLYLIRSQWRQEHALVFKERPEYRFILGEQKEVLDVVIEKRRIANRIIEEAMILANICAAKILKEKLGFGIYHLHKGFDLINSEHVAKILCNHGISVTSQSIRTLEGFLQLHRILDSQSTTQYLNNRIRRFQSFVEISTEPGPHFALGLTVYATWTSPIRKFGDMINHRLLKAIIRGENITAPHSSLVINISERRRLNRLAERDLTDWLYAKFITKFVGTNHDFNAEIIDVSRGGMRVRLLENGAIAFIPMCFIHLERNEVIYSPGNGTLQIQDKIIYRVTNMIKVKIIEVRMETRCIIASPIIDYF